MATGAPVSETHSEDIVHYGAVRLRVTGSGNLRMTFLSLDEDTSSVLSPIVLQATTGREPLRLANFISQRGMLEISTTAINEKFRINRVIIFEKPLWTEYPG
jgi:hypothetical protein